MIKSIFNGFSRIEKRAPLVISNRFGFYYGWIVTVVASLCLFFSGPGQTYFTSVFIDSYIKDLGWSRTTISSLYSVSTLIAGLLLFFVGQLCDRIGQKKVTIAAVLLLGVSSMWNSFLSALWMLFLGFFMGRLAGQGSMTLIPSTVIPRWFIKKRALALSIVSADLYLSRNNLVLIQDPDDVRI